MTSEEFNKYKFTIKTQVKVKGDIDRWLNVTEINFGDERIGMENGYYLHISEIENIREGEF